MRIHPRQFCELASNSDVAPVKHSTRLSDVIRRMHNAAAMSAIASAAAQQKAPQTPLIDRISIIRHD